MEPESKASGWVANLRHQFIALCSEADIIIPQEPIEFVRNQFLAAGETFKLFCAELLEDSLGCLEEKLLDSPPLTLRPKENRNDDQVKPSTPKICSQHQEGKTEQTVNFAEQHFAVKADESVHSSGLSEGKEVGGIVFIQTTSEWEKLDKSDCDFCSDFDVEKTNNHLRRTASVEEWDEDLCESDWEII